MQIPRSVWLRRSRDLILAIIGGVSIAAVSYAVLTHPQPASIGDFFLLRALSEGGGSNVVNVLLVDFRGFDTMGEITVLAIVALTVSMRCCVVSVQRQKVWRHQNNKSAISIWQHDKPRPSRSRSVT